MENLTSGKVNAQKDESEERLHERKSDVTSKDTLKDIEESGKVPDSKSERGPGEFEMPSPDGVLDETRDKNDDAGPM
jgi:hypothetical protein